MAEIWYQMECPCCASKEFFQVMRKDLLKLTCQRCCADYGFRQISGPLFCPASLDEEGEDG